MAKKARDAFRTISEVSDTLDTPAHVLRFWESKFTQVKPVKRAGGRRYYRPDDVALLGGIKTLLHDNGMTIKAVQKMLRSEGVKHVAGLADAPSEADSGDVIDHAPAPQSPPTDNVVAIETRRKDPEPAPPPAEQAEPLEPLVSDEKDDTSDYAGAAEASLTEPATDERTTAEVDAPEITTAVPPPTPIIDDIASDSDSPDAAEPPDVADDDIAARVASRVSDGDNATEPLETKSAVPSEPTPEANGEDAPKGHADADLPPLLDDALPPRAARMFDALANASPAELRERRDRIAPLLDRLEAVRDAMRAPS